MTNYSRSWFSTSQSRLYLARRPRKFISAIAIAFGLALVLHQFQSVDVKYVESCEKSYATTNPNEVSLHCQLRTLNTDFDQLNLSTITSSPPEAIVSLSLQCSNVLFYQSTLSAASFQKFSKLHTLAIEHCKLSRLEPGVLDGLRLKNLTINTYNTAWPALSLDLSPGVLSAVPTLERIDLSQNNIWTFPDQIFCPVTALEYLNVSLNRLQDIGDLGFREASDSTATCQINVQIFDISYNRLILLPSNGLAKLEHLEELYVQGNEISVVANQALGHLKRLRVLNLSHNKITSFQDDIFNESLEISEIYLQNNSIASLAAGLFAQLVHLQVLDLSYNQLTSLEPSIATASAISTLDLDSTNILHFDSTNSYHLASGSVLASSFSNLERLVLLNLGHNQITRIESTDFHGLYSLQVLNLEHNQIETIEPDAFASLNNLHTLILSHNLMNFIDATSLNGLSVLMQLSIDNNNISGIHRDSFQNCSTLKDLNLNGNALTVDVEHAIQNLTHLKTIDLGENQLESVPQLTGLPNLYGLRLTGNRIVNVSKDAFLQLASLKILNLARNQLKLIEEGAFDENLNLQALRLDANYLTDISNLFTQSPNLIWLNISDNQLTWFDYALIPKQLQWLDLHKNSIADLGNYFQVQDLRLATLDASYNRISSLSATNLPNSLEMIFLNDNLIRSIDPHTFLKKANLSRVDVFANQIETLELSSVRLGSIPLDKQLPEMYLAGNPIICDCNSEWLQRINKLGHLRQYFKIVDLESVYCRIVNEDLVLPLADVQPAQFLCPYTNHCFNLCECCEYSACDCQQQCPQNCDCFNDDIWATNIVDCSNRGHSKMPANIPMDASHLHLDGNTIEELPSHALIGMRNLQILHLNNSGIARIANNSFSGLKRLTALHLENNHIQRLEGFEFLDLAELRELYMQNNQLTFISNTSFLQLTQLEVLRLDHNKLTHFEMWTLSVNSYLVAVNLGHNEWSCECEFLSHAMPWAKTNIAKLDNPGSLTCNLYGRSFSLLYMNGSRCADAMPAPGRILPIDIETSEADSMFVPFFMIGLTVFLLAVLIVVLLYKRRKSKSQSSCSWSECYKSSGRGQDEDGQKLYDAYLCYSWKDEPWVQILEHTLASNSPAYRLCLHHELSKPAYISDMILAGAESSKRTVLIISRSFVQDEWCQPEFKSAICSIASVARRKGNELIIILLNELPAMDLDPDLRVLLRTSTLLSADDKQFVPKLKSALPTPRQPYSSSRPVPQSYQQQQLKDQNLNLSFSSSSDYEHQIRHYMNHSVGEPIYTPLQLQTPTGQLMIPQFPPVPRRPPPPLPPTPTPSGESWGI